MSTTPRPYQRVVIIFNPNSTGDGPANARELAQQLREMDGGLKVDLVETKHAGHAVDLAYDAANSNDTVLIISASGDGGYHEVVNGAMKAQDEGKGRPICAVLASGNANDHARIVVDRPLIDSIRENKTSEIDLLRITVGSDVHYTHSYAGLGLTPVAAVELNKHTVNAWRELLLMIKTFRTFKPFKIEHDGAVLTFDSLLFANIDGMAKVVQLSENGNPDDGRYEVTALPHGSKFKLMLLGLRAITKGLPSSTRTKPYAFRTIKPMPMQLDGEVVELKTDTNVKVEVVPHALVTFR